METKTIMTIMEILLIGVGGMVIYFAYWVYAQIKKKDNDEGFKSASAKSITHSIIDGMGVDILADGCKAVTPINTKTNDH